MLDGLAIAIVVTKVEQKVMYTFLTIDLLLVEQLLDLLLG